MKFPRMRLIRDEIEMTQDDLAKILGVHRSTYAGWEIGKDTIPLRKLKLLSDYLKISIDYIVGLSNENNYIKSKEKDIKLAIVARNLKTIRKEQNLNQKDIYMQLNTTSSTYSAYETGKVLIQTSFLYIIANKYKYSIDWIISNK